MNESIKGGRRDGKRKTRDGSTEFTIRPKKTIGRKDRTNTGRKKNASRE
jgi:hypothetical protein